MGRVLLDDLAAEYAAQMAIPSAHENEKSSSAKMPEPAASTQPAATPGQLAVSAARAAQQNHGALKAGAPVSISLTCGPVNPIVLAAKTVSASSAVSMVLKKR